MRVSLEADGRMEGPDSVVLPVLLVASHAICSDQRVGCMGRKQHLLCIRCHARHGHRYMLGAQAAAPPPVPAPGLRKTRRLMLEVAAGIAMEALLEVS